MSTKTIEKKVIDLSREVATLRSLVISLVTKKDPEGEYKPEFIDRILKAALEPAKYAFAGGKDFLKRLLPYFNH